MTGSFQKATFGGPAPFSVTGACTCATDAHSPRQRALPPVAPARRSAPTTPRHPEDIQDPGKKSSKIPANRRTDGVSPEPGSLPKGPRSTGMPRLRGSPVPHWPGRTGAPAKGAPARCGSDLSGSAGRTGGRPCSTARSCHGRSSGASPDRRCARSSRHSFRHA